jgi:Protease II
MLFIQSVAKTMREFRYLPADDPTDNGTDLCSAKGHEYSADYDNGEFYIVTNRDGAENFKVMKAPDRTRAKRTGRISSRTILL